MALDDIFLEQFSVPRRIKRENTTIPLEFLHGLPLQDRRKSFLTSLGYNFHENRKNSDVLRPFIGRLTYVLVRRLPRPSRSARIRL